MKRVYNKKVQPREFEIGDLVLKENQQQSHIERPLKDKFAPNWLEPYIVKQKFSTCTYHLADMEGREEMEPMNILHLYPFYI